MYAFWAEKAFSEGRTLDLYTKKLLSTTRSAQGFLLVCGLTSDASQSTAASPLISLEVARQVARSCIVLSSSLVFAAVASVNTFNNVKLLFYFIHLSVLFLSVRWQHLHITLRFFAVHLQEIPMFGFLHFNCYVKATSADCILVLFFISSNFTDTPQTPIWKKCIFVLEKPTLPAWVPQSISSLMSVTL